MTSPFIALCILAAAALSPEEQYLRVTGGDIVQPGTGKGKVVFTDVTGNAKVVNSVVREIRATYCLNSLFDSSSHVKGFADACHSLSDLHAEVGVFVVDVPDAPSVISAAESGWAMVNIWSLRQDNPTQEVFDSRLKKELWRAFAYVVGCGISESAGSVMMPVHCVKDLDGIETVMIAPDSAVGMDTTLARLGIERFVIATYRDACQEGWAPAPTNDIQKVIWNQVHAIPDKPMKITFDPATQKGRVTK